MVAFDLYGLLTGSYTSGGTWTQVGSTPQVVPMPAPGAVPANIDKEFLTPGTYTFTYQAPATCGAPSPVNTTLTIKEKPVVAVAPNPLYYCAKNSTAPSAQAVTTTVTNQSNGSAWSGGTLTYAWSNGGTGSSINYIPPGPYTSEQLITLSVTATGPGSPACSGTASTVARVSPNINDGSASNTIQCQGNASPYNVNVSNIMGSSTPVVSGNGIRREIKIVNISSGATSIPKVGGGSVAVGSFINWDQFQDLNLSGFATGVVITFQYKVFYQFVNGTQGCTFTSSNFTVTIQVSGSSGSPSPQTLCNG